MTAPAPRPLAELVELGPQCVDDKQTPCPARPGVTHCRHWYDGGEPCCYCGDDTDLD